MRIGIIGAGNIGTALVKRLAPHGHELMLSFHRNRAALSELASSLGVASGTPAEAVAFAEVVVLAVPWGVVPDALREAGSFNGKILWDCTNALKSDMSGLEVGTTTSAGELVAQWAGDARVVKGVPPFAQLLHSDDPTIGGQPPSVFVAGADAQAKAAVSQLMSELPATVTDAGPLEASRFIEPAMMLVVHMAYRQGFGPRIAMQLMR